MTVGRARAGLAVLWIASSLLMFVILAAMTVFQRFKEWDMVWNWYLPLTCPIVGLIITTLTFSNTRIHNKTVKDAWVYWIAVGLSIVYIVCIFGIVLLQPITGGNLGTLMKSSGWYLGVLQGFVSAMIGKFFVENI
jgi:hypothetical protein